MGAGLVMGIKLYIHTPVTDSDRQMAEKLLGMEDAGVDPRHFWHMPGNYIEQVTGYKPDQRMRLFCRFALDNSRLHYRCWHVLARWCLGLPAFYRVAVYAFVHMARTGETKRLTHAKYVDPALELLRRVCAEAAARGHRPLHILMRVAYYRVRQRIEADSISANANLNQQKHA